MAYKRTLTETEVLRMFAQAEGNPQAAAILHLIWDVGLTVAETAGLRWANVNLKKMLLRTGQREIPLTSEAVAALKRLERKSEWVFPSARNLGAPLTRMTVNRQLRQLLDDAGLPDLSPREMRNQYLLRVMEQVSLEEAVRITGIQPVTLRDTWREYGRDTPPRPTPAGSLTVNDTALSRALDAEGDSLDSRIVRLSWQGGLTLREIQALRWADVSPNCQRWTLKGEPSPVPGAVRPWLAKWRDQGGTYVVEGPRSGGALELDVLSKRAKLFFARNKLEGLSLSCVRGAGQTRRAVREALLELVQKRGYCSMEMARKKLGMTPNQINAAAASLRQEGKLAPEGGGLLRLPDYKSARERFTTVLDESVGEVLTTALLRERSGISGGMVRYYIQDAIKGGRLCREGWDLFRVMKA